MKGQARANCASRVRFRMYACHRDMRVALVAVTVASVRGPQISAAAEWLAQTDICAICSDFGSASWLFKAPLPSARYGNANR